LIGTGGEEKKAVSLLVGILSSETISTSTDSNDEDGEKTIMDEIIWMYSGKTESEQGKKGERMSSVQVFVSRLREYPDINNPA